MRHDSHADRVFLCRRKRAIHERRIIVSMDDVMRRPGMLRLFCKHLFQNLARLELVLVGLVETVSRGEERKSIKDARLTIVRVALRDLTHLAHISRGTRWMVELLVLRVERGQRVEIIALALRAAADREGARDCFASSLEIVRPRR